MLEARSGNGSGKNNFLVRKWGQDLENRVAHPHDEFPGIPPPGKFISVTSSVVLSFSCLLILLFLSREHIVLFFLSRLLSLKRANIEFLTEGSKNKYFRKLQRS